MAIGRSQMRKQVEGQIRGARDEKRKVRTYKGGGMKNGRSMKIKKIIKGLSKASKTHAAQAKTLKGVLNGSKKRNGKKA
jgi:hypothetical protein|tara:strand:- start:952 stop:1188 length:237 start_codon:yes stop_codon:yes gene_type:complete